MAAEMQSRWLTGTGYRSALLMVATTLAVCVAAIFFRTAIRARYWAWQVQNASSETERALAVALLCNAGDAGRWGTKVILHDPDPEIRQYGVLVLNHARGDWAHERLFDTLSDPDRNVRQLAALGIGIHGRPAAIDRLVRIFAEAEPETAGAAAWALARFPGRAAEQALVGLPIRAGDVWRSAAVIDALEARGTVAGMERLLAFLEDHRDCPAPTREELVLAQVAPWAQTQGIAELASPASGSGEQAADSHTLAERAAAALARNTGVAVPFASSMPKGARRAAREAWQGWIDAQASE